MEKSKDVNRAERLRKIFQRRGDLINANYSFWSALITLNGIILGIIAFAGVSPQNKIRVIYSTTISMALIIFNFYTLRKEIINKINDLVIKTHAYAEGKDNPKQKNAQKWYMKAYNFPVYKTCFKEFVSLACIGYSFFVIIRHFMNNPF